MSSGTPPYVFPPFGNIPKNWVLFGDGHFGPVSGGGSGLGVPEFLVVCDTSAGDVLFTLPDPATLPDPKSIINVKNINGGVNTLTIAPGIAVTIDSYAGNISTHTNNQGYRFRLAQSADTKLPDGSTPTGWVCIETCFGGDVPVSTPLPPAPYTPGPCSAPIPSVGSFDIQIFRGGTFTWAKPAGFKAGAGNCVVDVIGPGGGGAAGTWRTCAGLPLTGGQCGGGGARGQGVFDPASLPATVAVSAPLGGAGGLAVPGSFNPPGANPSGPAEFGSVGDPWYVKGDYGHGGNTGVDGSKGGGGQVGGSFGRNGGGYGGGSGVSGGSSVCGAPAGGNGAEYNCPGAPAYAWDGGDGGVPFASGIGGGAHGGFHGAPVGPYQPAGNPNGADGADGGNADTPGGGGGGGGMGFGPFYGNPGTNAGNGGIGGFPGAGGGGGGSLNPVGIAQTAGNGGRGGDAIVRVTTLLV